MQTKNRKIKKEELELWKKVTEHDKVLGQYATSVEENIIQEITPKASKIKRDNSKVKDTKRIFFNQDYQINKRMKLKLERGLIRPEIKLDLHGKTLSEAKKSLTHFIKSSIKNNIRCILVITGKKKTVNGSRGLIRENLPLWLKENELFNYILFHCYAIKKDGDDGARYILLRKKDKVFYD
ncbi:MAG: Smr/MutS family protein [Pseudomonadota bacterium]|nr:Smr/MutS family protein [Pseudomonadota bacterium]